MRESIVHQLRQERIVQALPPAGESRRGGEIPRPGADEPATRRGVAGDRGRTTITLLFFAATPFGWLAWIGWALAPHLLVAILSLPFWQSHPLLVIIAWIMAFVGTAGEGRASQR